jgi:hypothetical protein
MKNKSLWMIMVASASCLFALRACADTVNVPMQVVDQDGQPVAEALLESDSGDKKLSDENGKAFLEVKKKAFYNRFYAKKKGYYPTATDSEHSPLAKDFDSSKLMRIQLNKIKNPIQMYAKSLTAEQGGILKMPNYDGKSYGYDLVICDWVAPQGKGNVPDFIFMFEGDSGRVIDLEEWEKIISIRFSNVQDGIIAWEGASEAGRKYGSELVSDYEAPKEGYQDTWVQRTWKEKGGYHQTTSNMDRNFYFRVRTKVDEKGNIVSAHYGKIYGDFMSFIYYLNPTPNDRNVEFDPKRNLLPDGNVQRP